jgi:tRNA threonylcarbamoyladenosine biosynthesis protein TsaB
MTILAIDSSGQTASVALLSNYIIIGELSVHAPSKHSEILLPMIDRLLTWSNKALDDIDAVACVNGPGSFTGLRIGAATAIGLARGASKGLIAVPTLDALAYNIMGTAVIEDYIMPMLDARRGQVYTALYQSRKRVTEYMALPLTEALTYAQEKTVIFLGDGACAYQAAIREALPAAIFAPANQNYQRAASAGLCALDMIQNGYVMPPSIEPMYIRKPQAVREREAHDHDNR